MTDYCSLFSPDFSVLTDCVCVCVLALQFMHVFQACAINVYGMSPGYRLSVMRSVVKSVWSILHREAANPCSRFLWQQALESIRQMFQPAKALALIHLVEPSGWAVVCVCGWVRV